MPDPDKIRLFLTLQERRHDVAQARVQAERYRQSKQAHDGLIVGFDSASGKALVDVAGGIVPAESLADGLTVGTVCSYFHPRGAGTGFIDARISG